MSPPSPAAQYPLSRTALLSAGLQTYPLHRFPSNPDLPVVVLGKVAHASAPPFAALRGASGAAASRIELSPPPPSSFVTLASGAS